MKAICDQRGESFMHEPALEEEEKVVISLARLGGLDEDLVSPRDARPARLEFKNWPDVLHFGVDKDSVVGLFQSQAHGLGEAAGHGQTSAHPSRHHAAF